jgi:serine/threonine protein kinase
MQKLMLAGNHLQTLPEALANCKKLGLLRISANKITEFPKWLLTMPQLSWLAFAGNPFSTKKLDVTELAEIIWEELEIAHQLGEGASGIIALAKWQNELLHPEPKDVAVKVFKGEVTSDGLPADEMNASIAAGSHPNLVEVLGKIHQHPLQKQGLVFKLIPPGYKNLGGPPSFETCTRDVFPKETAFSVDTILKISLDIASAAAHLHERGIMHGDLYAHNILVDEKVHALFGDFGAATVYKGFAPEIAEQLERLEVSAFGCLLEDLLTHVLPEEKESTIVSALFELQKTCVQAVVLERPDFKTVFDVIVGLV